MAKSFLTKTLVQGWWGIVSFFVNFFAVYTDTSALRKFGKLDPPVGQASRPGPPQGTGPTVPPEIPPTPRTA